MNETPMNRAPRRSSRRRPARARRTGFHPGDGSPSLRGRLAAVSAAVALVLGLTVPAVASGQEAEELAERARNAAQVLQEMSGAPDDGVPDWLLERAHCVAVLPKVVKAGFIVAGRHGKGLVSCREGGGWSRPSFVSITGGSFGLQIGAEATDFILVFTREGARETLSSDGFTLGADASVAAGPVGRTAEAATDVELDSEIYAYSRSRGAFAGVSIEGSELADDDDANRAVYGEGTTSAELLASTGDVPAAVAPFLEALRTLVPRMTERN